MGEYRVLVSGLVLLAVASSSCAQNYKKEANLSATAGPELRWKYEAGG
jgi:hypothetical protein